MKMALDTTLLKQAITQAGHQWRVRTVPAGERPRGLGWEPSDAGKIQRASLVAESLMRQRFPTQFARYFSTNLSTNIASTAASSAATATPANAVSNAPSAGAPPASFDWRDRGVIGPVTDQAYCGSCVSFATAGMTAAMAAIERGAMNVNLSEADQHFASSHGPNCGGWNNDAALGQIKARGIATESTFPYMSAFDNPPQLANPADPNSLWAAHNRAEMDRAFRTYSISDYSAWTGDSRKAYLSSVGPMVCGFAVYEDFDSYGGGVYHHVSGKFRGGHAVMVIGYSDVDQCWICRNSWGTGFGGPADPDGTGAGFFKIGYGQCNIDSEPFYGCHGIIMPATTSMVTGVSRNLNKLDVFTPGTNRGTYTAAMEGAETSFRGWWQVQGGVVAPGTFMHAVSRSPDKLDLFCVGTDHGTYTAAWQPGDTSWRGWWRIQGGVAAPGTSIHAVSRSADHLDIFCVGTDGHVYTAAWQPGDTSWRGWWKIGDLKVAPNTSVFAVSRSKDKLDIFAVGADMGIYTAAWEPGFTSWHGWWRVQGGVAAPNSSVYAVSRSPDKLDIFCVGSDHGIYTAAWEPGFTSWHGWWRIQGGVAAPNTSVFGVSRSANKLDIFAVGTDHGIYTAAWEPGFTSWHGWWRVASGTAAADTSVFAVSKAPDQLDIFAIGTDHNVINSHWQPGLTSWKPWMPVAGGIAEGG